jgi:hypothetical protein
VWVHMLHCDEQVVTNCAANVVTGRRAPRALRDSTSVLLSTPEAQLCTSCVYGGEGR